MFQKAKEEGKALLHTPFNARQSEEEVTVQLLSPSEMNNLVLRQEYLRQYVPFHNLIYLKDKIIYNFL